MKHPLNRKLEKTSKGASKERKWRYSNGIYRREASCHVYCSDYCLGERIIEKPTSRWIGSEVDIEIYEKEVFDMQSSAFEWLKEAKYKEYGCRLFCTEDTDAEHVGGYL